MRRNNNNKKIKRKNQKPVKARKQWQTYPQWVQMYYGPRRKIGFQWNWEYSTLKYVQTVTFTVAAATYAENRFRANSIFDPDLTGTGGQPLGYDNLSVQFNAYRVNSYRYDVKMMSLSASYKGVAGIVNGSENPTTFDEACEFPMTKSEGIGFNGSPTAKFLGHKQLSEVGGRGKRQYHSDDITAAAMGTNPVEAINFHVGIQNDNLASITVNVTCTMWYETVFYDPIIPVRSLTPKKLTNRVQSKKEFKDLKEHDDYQDYLDWKRCKGLIRSNSL